MTTAADVLKLLKDKEVKFVDLRFTDTKGKEQHVTVPSRLVDATFFEHGGGRIGHEDHVGLLNALPSGN